MMSMEEIRKMVKTEPKQNKPLNEKLFSLFSSIGLIIGLICYTFTVGILFGLVVFSVWGYKQMCNIITNLFKHRGCNNISENEKKEEQES